MASILDRYGIKEVADVTFYKIGSDGKPTVPVLYLDTLKVSTIEQTAETTEARGGKGNPPLIVWDYGKEINVTLEDALFSAKSMAIMFGNGKVAGVSDSKYIMRTEVVRLTNTEAIAVTTTLSTAAISSLVSAGWQANYTGPDGKTYKKEHAKFYADADATTVATSLESGKAYFCTYDLVADDVSIIEISPSTFPGTYYVTGDTYARSEANGEDEFFQFVIPKAKVLSENTITLEAEGDPSVFNMNLRVLRPVSGGMMRLIKYNLANGDNAAEADVTLIHNHQLAGN